jgi:hypothetical protein
MCPEHFEEEGYHTSVGNLLCQECWLAMDIHSRDLPQEADLNSTLFRDYNPERPTYWGDQHSIAEALNEGGGHLPQKCPLQVSAAILLGNAKVASQEGKETLP